jgi:hypothetical protein
MAEKNFFPLWMTVILHDTHDVVWDDLGVYWVRASVSKISIYHLFTLVKKDVILEIWKEKRYCCMLNAKEYIMQNIAPNRECPSRIHDSNIS